MSLSVETYVLAKNYTDSVIDSSGAGVVPNITITAVQLEADEQPTVTKGGTNVNPTFELGIPKGKQGPQGLQGPQGEQGPQGPAGQDAPQIDDTKITTANPWSSAKIVETVCQPFEISGPIVTCNPVAGYPLHVISQIVPVQEGEGDPSPENVRHIVGWDSAKLWHGGRNLFDISKVSETVGITNNGDSLTLMSTGIAVQTKETLGVICPGLKAGNSYTISATTTGKKQIYIVGTSKMWTFGNPVMITEEDLKSTIYFYIQNAGTSAIISSIMVNEGQTASPYEPYNPNSKTITLPFGQTVYGGELDWTTGVLTVDMAYLQLTSASDIREYPYYGTKGVAFFNLLNVSISRGNGVSSHAAIDTLGGSPSMYPGGYMWIGVNNTPHFYWVSILDVLGIQTIKDFKSWLDTQYVQVVYTLPDPISIQLTPQEILALSGTNTICTDTGDTTVSGRADPISVINKLAERIAALESATTNI